MPRSRPWPSLFSINGWADCVSRRRFTGRFLPLTPITTMRGTCWGSSQIRSATIKKESSASSVLSRSDLIGPRRTLTWETPGSTRESSMRPLRLISERCN